MLSGGVDSSILLAELLAQGHRVQPFYVSMGCCWDEAERQSIVRYMEALECHRIQQLVEFNLPIADLYGDHWSVTGRGFPDDSTPDEAVFMWARNPMLLLKPLLWCQQHGIAELALGTLLANPFADATQEYLHRFAAALPIEGKARTRVVQPFRRWSKQQVLLKAANLPLQWTFSCLAPQRGLHCGRCNKCAERHDALEQLPGGDPTQYANSRLSVVGSLL